MCDTKKNFIISSITLSTQNNAKTRRGRTPAFVPPKITRRNRSYGKGPPYSPRPQPKNRTSTHILIAHRLNVHLTSMKYLKWEWHHISFDQAPIEAKKNNEIEQQKHAAPVKFPFFPRPKNSSVKKKKKATLSRMAGNWLFGGEVGPKAAKGRTTSRLRSSTVGVPV